MFRPGTKPQIIGGPGQPPSGFLNGNNSLSEWYIYWALQKELGPPENGMWTYQVQIMAQLPGGMKPDFMVNQEPPLVLRVQTERFHIAVNSYRQAYDEEQRVQLERRGYRVIDIFEEDYIKDETGAAARTVVREALAGVQRPNPARFGTSSARG